MSMSGATVLGNAGILACNFQKQAEVLFYFKNNPWHGICWISVELVFHLNKFLFEFI